MNYEEAKEYVKEAGMRGSVLGLDNMTNLMNQLNNVQDKLNVVHIAGTNGKGSTSAYITQILIEAGYKVGKYTSPAVFNYQEIFSVNNVNISKEDYGNMMEKVKTAVELMEREKMNLPTSFEIETALAFIYFYDKKCDIVVLETGLGGRLDATNIIKSPILSVITSISMDHNRFLGNSIKEVAWNKAGIIKQHCLVVSSVQTDDAMEVLKKMAAGKQSEITVAGCTVSDTFKTDKTIIEYESVSSNTYKIETSMLGTFQKFNISTAIEAAEILKHRGMFIHKENIETGIRNAVLPGRFEKINGKPLIYIDGGHNPGAAVNIRDTLEIYFTNRKLIYIIGVLADKDYDKVLSLTANLANEIITITPPDNDRALDGRELKKTALKYNSNVQYAGDLDTAVRLGKEKAGEDGVLFIFGSLSYLGKIRKIVRKINI